MTKICLIDLVKSRKDKLHTIINPDKKLFGSGVPVAMWEPFSLEYLGAYLIKNGHEVLILQQREKNTKDLLTDCLKFNPDFVGFSTYTYNLREILSFNEKIKKELPQLISILGGYHPSGDFSIINNSYVDFLIYGEGELTLEKIVESKNKDEMKKTNGIIYKEGKNIKINPPIHQLEFSTLPWPIRDKKIITESKIAPLGYPDPSNQKAAAMISYSRGCKHRCSFCASSLIWSRISHRNASDVIEEINYLQDEFDVNVLFFTDLTFNAIKKRAIKLCELIRKEKLEVYWYAYINSEIDKETLEAMKDAGCSRVGIGIESVFDSDLNIIKNYQSYEKTKKVLEVADSLGMLTRGYLCIGLPTYTKEKMSKFSELLMQLPVDQIRIGFITPFVGTLLYKQLREKIKTEPELYTTEYPVINNPDISDKDLIEIRDKIIRQYYNNPLYAKRINQKIKKFPHLEQSFNYFFQYLKQYEVMRS